MDPKITAKDAANLLGCKTADIHKRLKNGHLPYKRSLRSWYFGHETARHLFDFRFAPKVFAFQIVKGGTGKTSIAHEFAVRANLYGAKVLCIDLDQQGNLTQTFNVDANEYPVMIDMLAENYPVQQAIIEVSKGIDLISSRIENTMLDEVIRLKKVPLTQIYRPYFDLLKSKYDVVVVDCPPNLGQSVSAMALASDQVISPVTPEKFALSGIETTLSAIEELNRSFDTNIAFGILLNKFNGRTILSQEAMQLLLENPRYERHLIKSYVRLSQEFPNAVARGFSVYDSLKPSMVQEDIDCLVQEVLRLEQQVKMRKEIFSKAFDEETEDFY